MRQNKNEGRVRVHPILSFSKRKQIRFSFDGRPLTGLASDTISSALHAAGIRVLSHSPRDHRPRGFFCAIGRCSSCFVNVNGIPNVRACVTYLERGMNVTAQRGRGSFSRTDSEEKKGQGVPQRRARAR
jgi:sarcosine oxidase subunit alpha